MPKKPKEPVIVQTVDKAAQILKVLAHEPHGVGVTEISRRIKVNPSTVYRILSTLTVHHLVEQDETTSDYRLGLGILHLSGLVMQSMDLRQIARPVMEGLRDQTGETVNLMVPDGSSGTYVDTVESNLGVRKVVQIGAGESLHCSGVGKAILAFLDPARVLTIADGDLPRITPNTITDMRELQEQLNVVRKRGYALDDEEGEVGTRCIGAPLFGVDGHVVGALSVSGPSYRLTRKKLDAYSELVVDAAGEISHRLGYIPNTAVRKRG